MSHWEEGLVPSKINHRESSSFQRAFQKHWVLRAGNVFQIILPISSLELEKKNAVQNLQPKERMKIEVWGLLFKNWMGFSLFPVFNTILHPQLCTSCPSQRRNLLTSAGKTVEGRGVSFSQLGLKILEFNCIFKGLSNNQGVSRLPSKPTSRPALCCQLLSPLEFLCASLIAQLVKNLPAMQETWV